jgi:hypothetical protein
LLSSPGGREVMRWYFNDASLQGQLERDEDLIAVLGGLLRARSTVPTLGAAFHVTRALPDRLARAGQSLRVTLRGAAYRDLRSAVLSWFDRTGPFLDDDRQPEVDDYFEFGGLDVTDSGLGEGARRIKATLQAATFSLVGGAVDFSADALVVDHGLAEDRLGSYLVPNLVSIDTLVEQAQVAAPPPRSWAELIRAGRQRYPRLLIPDAVFTNPKLAREPFEDSLAERVDALLKHLNDYMEGRELDGSEGPAARQIVDAFFTGDTVPFSGESATNRREFEAEMTFVDPENAGNRIFAHWHGKIRHRFFRLHFEWPVPPVATTLKVLYLGPKLTKS